MFLMPPPSIQSQFFVFRFMFFKNAALKIFFLKKSKKKRLFFKPSTIFCARLAFLPTNYQAKKEIFFLKSSTILVKKKELGVCSE